jgi:hypothetical protein
METRTSGQREDRVTGAIESQTSKVPSGGYLAAALSSMAASAILKIAGKDSLALFGTPVLKPSCLFLDKELFLHFL